MKIKQFNYKTYPEFNTVSRQSKIKKTTEQELAAFIASCLSTDDTLGELVHAYCPDDHTITASDGHILVKVSGDPISVRSGSFIPHDIMGEATGTVDPFAFMCSHTVPTIIGTAGNALDLHYPDIESVIPKRADLKIDRMMVQMLEIQTERLYAMLSVGTPRTPVCKISVSPTGISLSGFSGASDGACIDAIGSPMEFKRALPPLPGEPDDHTGAASADLLRRALFLSEIFDGDSVLAHFGTAGAPGDTSHLFTGTVGKFQVTVVIVGRNVIGA